MYYTCNEVMETIHDYEEFWFYNHLEMELSGGGELL